MTNTNHRIVTTSQVTSACKNNEVWTQNPADVPVGTVGMIREDWVWNGEEEICSTTFIVADSWEEWDTWCNSDIIETFEIVAG